MAEQQSSFSCSSMFDLKAELYRKREESKELKAHNTAKVIKGRKTDERNKGNLFSKKNSGVLERAKKDVEMREEDNIMQRARDILEEKTRIYDRIASASGIPDDDGAEGYLVDFQKKAIDRLAEHGGREMASTDETSSSTSALETSQEPDSVEVMHIPTSTEDGCLKLKEGPATLLSADMKRELRRQQWEKEAQETIGGPLHYANVQYDEIRTHGTGYYQFSKESNLRDEQMDLLKKLRKETLEGRNRSERVKEKRKLAMDARLAKIKHRRVMKEDTSIKIDQGDNGSAVADQGQDKGPKENELLVRDDGWRASAPVREWDIGKEKLPEWNAKQHMELKRNERENEFAPPQFYFDNQRTKHSKSSETDNKDKCSLSVKRSSDADDRLTSSDTVICSMDMKTVCVDNIPLPSDNTPIITPGKLPVVEYQTPVNMQVQSVKFTDQGEDDSEAVSNCQPLPYVCASSGEWNFPQSYSWQQEYAAAGSQFCQPTELKGLHLSHTNVSPPMFPSQQSIVHSPETACGRQSFDPKKLPTKSGDSRKDVIDKRFVQNKEASDEDLLGFTAKDFYLDAFAEVKAVAYTPGLFSKNTDITEELCSVKSAPIKQVTSNSRQQNVNKWEDPVIQTEGVIFGVPDFLQPASDVEPKNYQPGSFAAAKLAAAKQTEEEYKAAQMKTEYSSAPVLYDRFHEQKDNME